MSRPWMPLYIADYLADTAHLSAAEHGAYLLLIMHYWQTGSLPDDDRRLARIARMDEPEWQRARGIIREFFSEGWKHERIDQELVEAQAKYQKRAAAGRRGAEQKWGSDRMAMPMAKDMANTCQPQPQPHEDKGEGNARASVELISGPAFVLSDQVLQAIGADREAPEWQGFAYMVQCWLTLGCSTELIVSTASSAAAGKHQLPHRNYLDKAVRRAFEEGKNEEKYMAKPMAKRKQPTHETDSKPPTITQAVDKHIQRLEAIEGGSSEVREGSPRLLSQR